MMSIARRYVEYFKSIVKADKEILLANLIGYGILGVLFFLISFTFLFVFSILLSSLGFQNFVQKAIPLYFVWFFPVFFISIVLIKGFFFESNENSGFEKSYGVQEVQQILLEGNDEEKIQLLKRLHLIDLNPDFLMAKAVSIARTEKKHKVREAAFLAIRQIKSRNEIFEKYNVRRGLIIDQLVRLKSQTRRHVDKTRPITVQIEKMITIENNTNETFPSVKLIDDNQNEVTLFDSIPARATVDISLSDQGNLQLPIEVTTNLLSSTEIFVQLGNFSEVSMTDIIISLHDKNNEQLTLRSNSSNIEVEGERRIRIANLDPKSTIGFSIRFDQNPTMYLSFFAHFDSTLEQIVMPKMYMETEGSDMVKIRMDPENKVIIETTNIHNTAIYLEKIMVSYFSDFVPTTQLMTYSQQQIIEKIGSARLLPGQTVKFTIPSNLQETEFPSFHSSVAYFLEAEGHSATQIDFEILVD